MFLQQTAQTIFEKHQTNYDGVCVVLPTRRAVYYFKRHLAACSDRAFLAPEVLAIEDFVMQLSGTQLIDQVALTFELYEIFKAVDKQVDFQQFLAWSSTLLKDFDLIDQYLVEPKPLFDFMSEAKAIARWNLELQEAGKSPITEKSAATDRYFKLFDNLLQVYHALQSRLLEKGQAYRGMAYRILAEGIEQLLIEGDRYEKYYFVGFNALSLAEERIIQTLVKAKKATTFWDTDDYYMRTNHKAGEMLQRYKLSGVYGQWNWQGSELLEGEKHINIIGCQNSTLQAKVAGQLYADMLADNPETETAIVLADENLLMPLLYSLDEEVDDFNITMGLSLRSSLLFTLIDSLFELQLNLAEFRSKKGDTIKIPKFNHRHIRKVLMHPFIKSQQSEDPENSHNRILRHLSQNNIVYLGEQEILDLCQDDALLQIVFKRWNNNAERVMTCFYTLIDELRAYYQNQKNAIETEYLYLFLTLLNRLKDILANHPELDLKSFKLFLYELIRQTKIPFSGEPIAKLQVMGMLETRVLDFERLIILSMNEGTLPAGKRQNSLIPFDAAQEFGLPLHTDQDAVMSYHFFRLLQRAKQVDLLYVLPSGGGVGGGMGKSRFLMQVEHELAKQNPRIRLERPSITWTEQTQTQDEQAFEIQKNEQIVEELSQQIAEKGLYPSHISQFIRCSMQYYFSRVAKISESEEIEETLGADMFGNWLHYVLEGIDAEYSAKGRKIERADVEKIIQEIPQRLEQVHTEKMSGYVVESGMNFLLQQVAEQLLKEFFEQQLAEDHFPIDVLEVEKQLSVQFVAEVHGKPQKIKVAGRVDRIEREGKVLKVIDYKTGKVTEKDLQKDKDQTLEETLLNNPDKEKLRQLWLYEYLMLKRLSQEKGLLLSGERLNVEDYTVKAGIYSFRNLKAGLLEANFDFEGDIEHRIKTSEQYLTQFVSNLLNPDQPFQRTADHKFCQYCDFTGICGR